MAPPPWWHDRVKLTFVIAVGILALVVTALLLVVLNARGGEGAVATASPTPTSSAASTAPSPIASLAEPTASVEPSSSSRPSPTPSASPDPPQAELAEGWARINTGQQLHNNATQDSPIVTRLQPREVVWVSSGPYREDLDDDLDWYSVQTLDDKYGWIASGSPDDPLATTISNRFNFRSCGRVKVLENAALVNGLRTERLDAVERASFELAESMGTSACQRFSNDDYEPTVRLELDVHACGAPSWDGSVAMLQPTTAGTVDAAWRVPSTITVPSPLLTNRQRADADGLTNAQKLMILGSGLPSPFACVDAEVIGSRYSQRTTTELAGCLEMTARDTATVTFVAPGGEPVTLARSRRDGISDIALNDATTVRLTQGSSLNAEVLGDC
jgi:hypothetical protein